MKLDRLKFVKNIDDSERWAYADWSQGSQQDLHWANAKGDSTNADKSDVDDLILLVQKFFPAAPETRVTHLVKGTKIVKLENLKDDRVNHLWHSIEIFQRHVAGMLGLTED
jgi:hypothetical protein